MSASETGADETLAPSLLPAKRQDRTTAAYVVAQRVWTALVPTMAGGRMLRLSPDGGRNYPGSGQRKATDKLPNKPAAILVYDAAGRTPLFCVDLDVGGAGVDAVDRDFATVTALLTRVGLTSWVSDRGPTGGRHVYVPLAEPARFVEATAAARAMAARFPTMDPLPMLNVQSGCIRPPGSYHRTGGHQVLDGPVEAAQAALRRPNSPAAWRQLLAELGVDEDASTSATPPSTGRWQTAPGGPERSGSSPAVAAGASADAPAKVIHDVEPSSDRYEVGKLAHLEALDPLPGYAVPDAAYEAIARTGVYDTAKYQSDSHARQGVIWAAVAAGWEFTDVVRRLHDGTWRGLAAFYDRYADRHRHTALTRDWHNARDYEKRRRNKLDNQSVRVRTTSTRKSQPPHRGNPQQTSERAHRQARTWLTAVDLLHGKSSPAVRAVLYTLAQAAVLADAMEIEFGNRHLAIGAGRLDQSTVGRILNELLDEPADRALIDQIRPAQGVRAALYRLVIPPLLQPSCEAKPWRRGRIHGIRAVFRELGLTAAFVYDALERDPSPGSGRDIAERASIGKTAAYQALETLAVWGLAEKTADVGGAGGWVIGPASPNQLAESFGVLDEIKAQLARYRIERADWIAWLVRHNVIADPHGYREPPPEEDALPPPDLEHAVPRAEHHRLATALELLQRELGAQMIA